MSVTSEANEEETHEETQAAVTQLRGQGEQQQDQDEGAEEAAPTGGADNLIDLDVI